MRTLNIAQHNRFDRIDNEDPDAKVIGWDPRAQGPLVRLSDGRVQAISPDGRARQRARASQPDKEAA